MGLGEDAVGKQARLRNQRIEAERWAANRAAGPRSWEQRVASTWGGCDCGRC